MPQPKSTTVNSMQGTLEINSVVNQGTELRIAISLII
jgi:signal transduction histidine kinase